MAQSIYNRCTNYYIENTKNSPARGTIGKPKKKERKREIFCMKSKLQSSGRWSDPVAVIIDPLFSILNWIYNLVSDDQRFL